MGKCLSIVPPPSIERYLERLEPIINSYFAEQLSLEENNEESKFALKFLYNKMILDFCYTYNQDEIYLEKLRTSVIYDLLTFKNFLHKSNEFWMNFFLQNETKIISLYDKPFKKIQIANNESFLEENEMERAQTLIKNLKQDIYYYFNFNHDKLKSLIKSFYW